MKIKYYTLICILCLVSLAFTSFLFQPSPTAAAGINGINFDDRVPIRWFVGLGGGTQPDQIDSVQQVVDAFNASQTEIYLSLEVIEHEMAIPTLQTYIASGNAPDIVGPVGIKGSEAFKGLWLDLTPLIETTGYDLSDIDPALVELFYSEIHGQIGIPFAVYPSFTFYNRDIFNAAGLDYPPHEYGQSYADGSPWTVEKLAEIARLLTLDNQGRNATDLAFDPDNIEQFGYHQQWTDARGAATLFGAGSFVDEKGNAQIPTNWRSAFQWYYDAMWGDHPFMPNTLYSSTEQFGYGNVFNSGQLAMAHCHLWYVSLFGEPGVQNWDIAATPAYNGSTTSKMHADNFYILKSSKNPKEAFEVVTYLLGTAAPTLLDVYGGFPARTSLQADALENYKTKYPGVDWQVMVDSIQFADIPNHEGYLPNYNKAVNRIDEFTWDYQSLSGFVIDDALSILQTDLQEIFDGGTQITLQPGEDSVLTYYGISGLEAIIDIPGEAITAETTLVYTPKDDVTRSTTGLLFSGRAFDLIAYQDDLPIQGFSFAVPVTVSIFYEDNENVTEVNEQSLGLYYFDGAAWSNEDIPVIYRDVDNNQLTVTISHLTEFALFADALAYIGFLPLILH